MDATLEDQQKTIKRCLTGLLATMLSVLTLCVIILYSTLSVDVNAQTITILPIEISTVE